MNRKFSGYFGNRHNIDKFKTLFQKNLPLGVICLFFLLFPNLFQYNASQSGAFAQTLSFSGIEKVVQPEFLNGFNGETEKVKIVVQLKGFQSFKGLSISEDAVSMGVVQYAVRSLQDGVLNTLDHEQFKLRHRFDNILGFAGEATLEVIKKMAGMDEVAFIEEDREMEMHTSEGIPLIKADELHSIGYYGSGISIAICDSGVDYNHPELGGGGFPNSKVIGGYDIAENDSDPMPTNNSSAHGTSCAGIAAGDSGGGYAGGVAPSAKIYALKVFKDNGSGLLSDTAAAWDWCVTHKNDDPSNPILIISNSVGAVNAYQTATCDSGTYSFFATAAATAVSNGMTLFASSGNDGYCNAMTAPACNTDVISVGSVYDANFGQNPPSGYVGCISLHSCVGFISGCPCSTLVCYIDSSTAADLVPSYSNSASFLDILAASNKANTADMVGSGGYSSGNYTDDFGGTSAACPYAAGAGALLQEYAKAQTGSYLTPAQLKSALVTYGDPVTDSKNSLIHPRINIFASTEAIEPVSTTTTSTVETSTTTTSSSTTGNYWARTYGGDGQDTADFVQQTADGGYVILGNTVLDVDNPDDRDILILKVDSRGDIEWQKAYGGDANDYAHSIQQTVDYGYIVAGWAESFGGYSWVFKLEANGNVEWQKTFGWNGSIKSIKQTADGGFVVAGDIQYNAFVFKLASNGEEIWRKRYSGGDFNCIQQTPEGGYIVAGRTSSYGAGVWDAWVLKLDINGDIEWQKTYGWDEHEYANSISLTTDGGYIIAGYTEPSWDVWVLKLTNNGEISWQKTYGGSAKESAGGIEQTSDDGYIVGGWTNSFGGGVDVWVLKLTNNGEISWQKTYGGSSDDYSGLNILQTIDEGYTLVGRTSSFGVGYNDILFLKLDYNGDIPNCDIISTTDATISNTNIEGEDSSATVRTASVTITDTNMLPQDTGVEITTICLYLSPTSSSTTLPTTTTTAPPTTTTTASPRPTTTPPTPTTTPPPPPPSKTTTTIGSKSTTTTIKSITTTTMKLTTTTAIPTTTTTIPVPPPAQTTTIVGGLCSAEQIYGDDSEQADLLRYIRDNVLSKSPEGQEIIKLYYQWSPAIVQAMEEDEVFKVDMKEMVDGVLELIE